MWTLRLHGKEAVGISDWEAPGGASLLTERSRFLSELERAMQLPAAGPGKSGLVHEAPSTMLTTGVYQDRSSHSPSCWQARRMSLLETFRGEF